MKFTAATSVANITLSAVADRVALNWEWQNFIEKELNT